jgi:hypothetical protein
MPSDKFVIWEALKLLELRGVKGFTSKDVIKAFPVPYQNIQVSNSWLTECIKAKGYEWDKDKKLWVVSRAKKEIEIKAMRYERVKQKINKLESKIRAMLIELTHEDYCYKCPKRLFCKHVKHKGISKILAHQDICKAHKILLSKIAGLERILNE